MLRRKHVGLLLIVLILMASCYRPDQTNDTLFGFLGTDGVIIPFVSYHEGNWSEPIWSDYWERILKDYETGEIIVGDMAQSTTPTDKPTIDLPNVWYAFSGKNLDHVWQIMARQLETVDFHCESNWAIASNWLSVAPEEYASIGGVATSRWLPITPRATFDEAKVDSILTALGYEDKHATYKRFDYEVRWAFRLEDRDYILLHIMLYEGEEYDLIEIKGNNGEIVYHFPGWGC